jgi:hypothetical protein
MDLEGSGPQISKLGATTKMGITRQFLYFFHRESTKIDEKLYNDPFWIRNYAFYWVDMGGETVLGGG